MPFLLEHQAQVLFSYHSYWNMGHKPLFCSIPAESTGANPFFFPSILIILSHFLPKYRLNELIFLMKIKLNFPLGEILAESPALSPIFQKTF
jgi:hypothetical protein